jgi:hypothetical protein
MLRWRTHKVAFRRWRLIYLVVDTDIQTAPALQGLLSTRRSKKPVQELVQPTTRDTTGVRCMLAVLISAELAEGSLVMRGPHSLNICVNYQVRSTRYSLTLLSLVWRENVSRILPHPIAFLTDSRRARDNDYSQASNASYSCGRRCSLVMLSGWATRWGPPSTTQRLQREQHVLLSWFSMSSVQLAEELSPSTLHFRATR